MKAFNLCSHKELSYGDMVPIFKFDDETGVWKDTGENGTFEEVTPNGLINFNSNGKARQCMPEGIHAWIE